MDPLAFMGIVMLGWQLVRSRHGSLLYDRIARFNPPRSAIPWSCAALVLLFGAQIGLMVYRADTDMPRLWQASLPYYHLLDMGPFLRDPSDPLESGLALLVAILESACLAIAAVGYARYSGRAIARSFWTAVGCMAAMAIAAPVLAEKDIFEYLQCASLGFGCYAPGGRAFPDSLALVAANVPMSGSLYGPIWVAMNSLVALVPAPSLIARLEILRLYSALIVAAVAWLLWRTDMPKSARAAFILCPFIWMDFVTNAHIDMQAYLFIVAASLCVLRGRGILAGLLVGFAGLVKLPFVFLGGAVFIAWRSVPQRFLFWGIGALLTAGATYVTGRMYLQHLAGFGHIGTPMTPSHQAIATALQALTVIVTVWMVWSGRTLLGMMWIYPTGISPTGLPWYLAYSLPEGLALGKEFSLFISLLPLSAVLEDQHDLFLVSAVLASIVTAILVVDARASWKRSTNPAQPPLKSGR